MKLNKRAITGAHSNVASVTYCYSFKMHQFYFIQCDNEWWLFREQIKYGTIVVKLHEKLHKNISTHVTLKSGCHCVMKLSV